ncbi:MAG: hypothetical protein K8S24_07785 [Candidatus Aegiribacteria sp.]|nr:hypothetical protein [Candidatus Aegiribacteria sp.]
MNYLEQKIQVSSRKKIEELIVNRLGERSIDDLARDVEPVVAGRNELLRVKLFPEILQNWAGFSYTTDISQSLVKGLRHCKPGFE